MNDESPPAQGRYFTYHSLFLTAMNILVLAPPVLRERWLRVPPEQP